MKTLLGFFQKMSGMDKMLSVFVILGAVVVTISLFRGISESSKFEVVKSGVSNTSTKLLFVDVSGAVVSPGVFQLPSGSRLKDALILAGGFSLQADREYISKNLNLAEVLKDGQKVYIPKIADTTSGQGYIMPKNVSNLVNINVASVSELDTLWGIGESRAQDIVKNRPYKTLDELVSKKVLTKQILEKNKEKMTVY